MLEPIVIKVGGHQIDDPDFLAELAIVIRDIRSSAIVVHGGGVEISALQQQLGIEPRYLDGVRITDAISLSVVEMILCGVVNKRLVRYLVAEGVDALGMSGVDRGLIRARKMVHPTEDMGFTGEVENVRGEILLDLLERAVTPVVAPICLGVDAENAVSYNVNADHVAGAVALATGASKIVFLTNVEGVIENQQIHPMLTAQEAAALIENGTIAGGMIPKVRTALHALEAGVPQAVVTNLAGLKAHLGTVFVRSQENAKVKD